MLFMLNKKTYKLSVRETRRRRGAEIFSHSTLLKILPDEAHNKITNLIP